MALLIAGVGRRTANWATGTLTPADELTPVPTDVSGALQGKRITTIATGYHNTCVIASDQLYCWGANNNGQLANGAISSPVPAPAKVSGFEGKKVTAVTMGRFHVCAIADGLVYCWGTDTALPLLQKIVYVNGRRQ